MQKHFNDALCLATFALSVPCGRFHAARHDSPMAVAARDSRVGRAPTHQTHSRTRHNEAMSSSASYDQWADRDLALYACAEVEKLAWDNYLLRKEIDRIQTNHNSLRSWVQGNIDEMQRLISQWAARAHDALKPAWENVKGGTGVFAATPDGKWAGGAIVAS